jgi:hypothetical protein
LTQYIPSPASETHVDPESDAQSAVVVQVGGRRPITQTLVLPTSAMQVKPEGQLPPASPDVEPESGTQLGHIDAAQGTMLVGLQLETADAHMLWMQLVHAGPVEYAESGQLPPLLLPPLELPPEELPPEELPPEELPPELLPPPPSSPPELPEELPPELPFEASSPLPKPPPLELLEQATTPTLPTMRAKPVTDNKRFCITTLRRRAVSTKRPLGATRAAVGRKHLQVDLGAASAPGG